ncbi:uncharacterized protein TNCV_4139771 [Trichonephila clavipes]|nr:uncharacterized protein TNCV_4139771 [Trichonephila clavipes]
MIGIAQMFLEKRICGRVPKISSPVVITELNSVGIVLFDLENDDSEIDILIGANVAGLLFMDGCIELQSGLFLLKTRLGYVLTGRYPIGLSADIEKAFLQLGITPKHRDFLRFFYPDEGEEIVYRHCRVVFGVSSSPFLLAAVLVHLLENVPEDNTQLGSKLKLSFYVDNCVTGVNDIAQQEEFILRSRISDRKKGQLSLDESESAEIQLIRSVQGQSFTEDKLNSNLSVFREEITLSFG